MSERTDGPDDSHLQPLVAAEFDPLADQLETLRPDSWDTPSLCAGWRVREVVAHLTMAARYDEAAFMTQLKDAGFDFGALSNSIAGRDAELPIPELIANLRSETMKAWAPPGGGYRGALNHVVIHGLDVRVPLALARPTPDPALRQVLDDLTAGDISANFGLDLTGRRLEATDLDWAWGEGRVLRGPATELVLQLAGRAVPDSRLEGEPVARAAG